MIRMECGRLRENFPLVTICDKWPVLYFTFTMALESESYSAVRRPFGPSSLHRRTSLDCGRKPEHPEETHADTGRMCKLHTDSDPRLQGWCRREGFSFLDNWGSFWGRWDLYKQDGLHLNLRGTNILGGGRRGGDLLVLFGVV